MIGKLPKTWEIKELNKVVLDIIDYRGKTPRKLGDNWSESGIIALSAMNVKQGQLVNLEKAKFVSDELYQKWMKSEVTKGDILMTSEAPLGETYLVRDNKKICLSQRLFCIRANPDVILPRFLFYFFNSPVTRKQIDLRATGTTVLGIRQSDLRETPIIVPPVETQRKIAAILSAYDDLIENNTRRIKILEDMAQTLYQEWFVHFRFPGHESVPMVESPLGSIPQEWEVVSASEAIFVNPKTSVPRDTIKPFVPMKSATEHSMLITEIEEKTGNSGAKFKNGDTLFARITPCLENGRTGFVQFLPNDDEVAFGSTEFIVLRSKTLNPYFVYLLAQTRDFRENAIKSMTGATGRQRVLNECFDDYFLPNPNREMLSQFEITIAPLFKKVQNLSEKNANLRQTRDLLLPKLISGEIDVSELDIDTIQPQFLIDEIS